MNVVYMNIYAWKKKQCNIFLFKFYFNRNIPIDIQTFLNKVAQDGPSQQHKKKKYN